MNIQTNQLHTATGNLLVAEASDLGWPPGRWPAVIQTEFGDVYHLQAATNHAYMVYRPLNQLLPRIHVLND